MGYLLSTDTDGRYSGHVSGGGRIGPVHLSGGLAANGGEGFGLPQSYEEETWEDGGKRDYSGREDVFAWGRAAWTREPRPPSARPTSTGRARPSFHART